MCWTGSCGATGPAAVQRHPSPERSGASFPRRESADSPPLMPLRMDTVVRDSGSIDVWIKDYVSREHSLPGGIRLDSDAFRPAALTITADGAAAIGDTELTVDALTDEVLAGALIPFPGGQIVTTRAKAEKGATTLVTEPLTAAIADGAAALFADSRRRQTIPASTLVGRTFAEQAAGTPFGPFEAGDDEVYLTIRTVQDIFRNAETEALRKNTVVATNRMPKDFDSRPAAEKTKIQELYTCITAEG